MLAINELRERDTAVSEEMRLRVFHDGHGMGKHSVKIYTDLSLSRG